MRVVAWPTHRVDVPTAVEVVSAVAVALLQCNLAQFSDAYETQSVAARPVAGAATFALTATNGKTARLRAANRATNTATTRADATAVATDDAPDWRTQSTWQMNFARAERVAGLSIGRLVEQLGFSHS